MQQLKAPCSAIGAVDQCTNVHDDGCGDVGAYDDGQGVSHRGEFEAGG